MKTFKTFLGPEATKQQDRKEIVRQKVHLTKKAKEYHDMSKDEGGGGMAQAHGDMFDNAKKNIKEDGMGVAAVAGTGSPDLSPSQREPGVSKKRNPTMGYFRRTPPKA
jgi:hypothetical protein